MKKNKSIKQATWIYWLLLSYVVAALIWWYISLEIQNKERSAFEIQALQITTQPQTQPLLYQQSVQTILGNQHRRTAKHISEGLTFLIVITVGAIFVYRLVRKQLQLNKQQQNFIMAVTHELKTPIAISKLNIETLQKRTLEQAQQQKLLQSTLTEMHRLNDLATNILVVSQIETRDYKMTDETIDMQQLLQALVQVIKTQYNHRIINTTIDTDITINGDPLMIKLALTNFIDNALKYSDKASEVTILAHTNKIIIKDNGIGIADEDKKKIFEKFYRVGNEYTRTTKGTGLGLYLCKKILNDHNATIEITNNTPNGTNFAISFNNYQ